MGKKVSIIVAAYNVKPYIEKCLKSITDQTFNNIEIIVVDDGSTDGTNKICDAFKDKDFRVQVLHRENGGLSAARNSGLDIASGDYICFVDGDDYIKDTCLEELVEVAGKFESDIVLYSYFRDYGDRIVPYFSDGKTYKMNQSEAITELVNDCRVKSMACMKFYKSYLFDEIRFKEGHFYEDIYLMHHLFLRASVFVIYNVPLYYYLYREDSITNVQGEMNLYHRYESLFIRFQELGELYPQLKPQLSEKTAYSYVDIYNSIFAGKYSDEYNVKGKIREFFKKNSSFIPFKTKSMFFVVKIIKIFHLNKILYILMRKLINSK